MAKTPLYKRLKYQNIFFFVVLLAFVIFLIVLIKQSTTNDTSSSSVSDSSSANSVSDNNSGNSSAVQNNTETVLGKIEYTYMKFSESAIHDGTLILISPNYSFSGEAPQDCISSYDYMFNDNRDKLFSIRNNEVKARGIALENVKKMMSDFFSLYGSASVVLMNAYNPNDKTSEMSAGYSVEFFYHNSDGTYSIFNPIGTYSWIADNAYRYGFIMRYPSEKATVTGISDGTGVIRYVGMPHSQIMYKNNMCLEEYLEFLKDYSYDNAIGYTTDDGKNYAIYYAASEGAETNIKIPTDSDSEAYKFTISGNNSDGFIITVSLPD